MKVILISPVYPYPNRGIYPGIERHVHDYSNALIEAGADVEVITTFWNGGRATEKDNEVVIHRVNDSYNRLGKVGALFCMHFFTFHKNILKLKELIKSADVVHSITPLSCTKEIRKMKVPIVTHFHHKEEIETLADYVYRPIMTKIEKIAYQNSNALMTPSSFSASVLKREFKVKKKIFVLPHGIYPDRFKCQDKSFDSKILFVGSLIRRKGIVYLIKAMPKIIDSFPDSKLLIVGEGPLKSHLKSLSESLKVDENITFMGHVTEEELVQAYKNSDIFVFPSLKEGFGVSLLEAMASGLPIVTTRASAIPEVVGDSAILIGLKDSEGIARSVKMLLRNPKMRESLRKSGLKRVKSFDWKNITRNALKIYSEVIETTN